MSEAFTEAFEAEVFESSGETGFEGFEGEASGEAGLEGEGGFEGETTYEGYPEDARSDARRRRERRQRQIMQARQRQTQLRRRPSPPPPRRPAVPGPSPRQTIAAIRSDVRDLNLDTKLDLDAVRRALNEANRRGDRAMYSALLSIVGNQALATYDTSLGSHQAVSAAIRWAPSLLLSSSKGRPGIEGFLLSPPVIAGAVVAGIAVSGHFINAPQGAQSISIGNPSPINAGSSGTMTGVALDRHAHPLPNVGLTWSSQKGLLTFTNAATGAYTAGSNPGQDFITATGGGVTNGVFVTIVADTTAAPATPTPATPAVQDISILGPAQIPTGASGIMAATAVDQNGRPLPSIGLTWSSQTGLLTFTNTATGAYTAGSTAGPDFVTATGGGVTNGKFVTIVAATTGASGTPTPATPAPATPAPATPAPATPAPATPARRGRSAS
jgi:hypothetical protein